MIVNQQNLHGLNVAYSTAYNKAFQGRKTQYERIATVVPSTTASTDYKWLGQMPQMREWIGEREIQSLSAYNYGVYAPMFANIGEAAAEHPDVLVFDALKAGFKENCYDGKPFFAQDHASGKDGKQTVSNMTTEKLSTDAYVEARAAMMGLLGDQGKSLNIVPNLLVVSPANEKMGRLILEADQIEGTTNVLKGTAELLVVTELADQPDYWFLLATQKALKPIIYQKRKPIKLTSKTNDNDDTVFMKDQFIWGADGRSNAGYGFWQMAYGSTGTTSSKG